jgi:hypothetical protein
VKHQRPTAAQWFGRADEFWAAADLIGARGVKSPVIPNVVCRSFASEAYLKCLLTIRQKHFPPEHDLELLFRRLPDDDKKAIEEAWNVKCLPTLQKAARNAPQKLKDAGLIPNTLNQALKMAANAFKDWRYNPRGMMAFMLNTFPLHVRDVIIATQPDWRDDPPDAHGNQSRIRAQKNREGQAEAVDLGPAAIWRVVPGRPD